MVETYPTTADGAVIHYGETTTEQGDDPAGIDDDHYVLGLEREVAQLREALLSQRRIGMVVGILAGHCNLTTAQSWALLVRLSQRSNAKVRDVARVLHDDFEGRPTPDDAEFLAQITARLPQPIQPARRAGPRSSHPPRRR